MTVYTTTSPGYPEPQGDRYLFGACFFGLPWTDGTRTRCAGDCHR